MHPKLPAALIPLAVLGALLAPSAAHADPAPLPATDTVHVVECDQAGGTLAPLQVLAVDASTALLTPIGTGAADSAGCSFDATIDPTTGIAYIIASDDTLWAFDPATDATSLRGAFRLATDDSALRQLVALAVDPRGDAYGIDANGQLYSLDLATAEITPIGTAPELVGGINALAAHPITGELYAVTYAGGASLASYDTTTGALEIITLIAQSEIYTMGFDSSGTLWVLNYGSGTQTLASVDVADWSSTYSAAGVLRLASDSARNYYTEALFITSSAWPDFVEPQAPDADGGSNDGGSGEGGAGDGDAGDGVDAKSAPELAATGADSAVALSLGAAGALLLLAGGAAVMIQRRARATR